MTERITRADVERAARAHTRALTAAGLGRHLFAIEPGSKTNGIAWRMVEMDAEGRRTRPPIGRDAIGFTAREAYDTVTERTSLVWDMVRELKARGYDLLPDVADETD